MTGFTEAQKAALNADLKAGAVKSRTQSGQTLSYIEGWHAVAEANRIFGHDAWTRETVSMALAWRGEVNGKPAVTYTAKVRVTVCGVAREGTGAGHGIDRTEGAAHEKAVKEAETDATKRALMTFGWPFGLALYDKDQEHVEDAAPATPRAPTGIDPAIAKFFQRDSYEFPGDDLLQIADKIVRAAGFAWHADQLLKLEEDNRDHIAALNNQAPSSWKEVQTALTAARKRTNVLAA